MGSYGDRAEDERGQSHGSVKELQDYNWDAFDHASLATQLAQCQVTIIILVWIDHLLPQLLPNLHSFAPHLNSRKLPCRTRNILGIQV